MLNSVLAILLFFAQVVGIENSTWNNYSLNLSNIDEYETNMTPNLEVVYNYVASTYGLRMGVTKCKRISGRQTYSQHSWSNAVDIFTYDKDLQDRIQIDLKARFGSAINNVLTWRYNSAHASHVHVDW